MTSLIFGCSHLANLFGSSTLAEVGPQISSAFLAGSIFYILRHTTGSLVYAMALFALWDFFAFSVTHGDASVVGNLAGVADLLIGILALFAVPFVIKNAGKK